MSNHIGHLVLDCLRFLEKAIVSAAPICTLWKYDIHRQVYVFRFWPRIIITHQAVWMQRKWYGGNQL